MTIEWLVHNTWVNKRFVLHFEDMSITPSVLVYICVHV